MSYATESQIHERRNYTSSVGFGKGTRSGSLNDKSIGENVIIIKKGWKN